jgi:hypothetical protein
MDHPYRLSENESIVIDSRLSALESKAGVAVAWRRVGLVGFLAVVAFQGLFFAKLHHAETQEGCIDEVKMGRILAFDHPESTDVIETVTMKCDNPRQRGRIVSHGEGTMTIQCVCQ